MNVGSNNSDRIDSMLIYTMNKFFSVLLIQYFSPNNSYHVQLDVVSERSVGAAVKEVIATVRVTLYQPEWRDSNLILCPDFT